MKTRMLLIMLSFAAGGSSLSGTALAAPEEGCVRLAEVVFVSLTDHWYPSNHSAVPDYREALVCDDVAATVSRAFTSAMSRSNIHIVWSAHGGLGDLCLSHKLSECYPRRNPLMPPGLFAETAFVAEQWQAVQWTISARLLHDSGGDTARFQPVDLQRTMALTLAHTRRSVLSMVTP